MPVKLGPAVQVPLPSAHEVGPVLLGGQLVKVFKHDDQVLPVLHVDHVRIVDHDHLNGGKVRLGFGMGQEVRATQQRHEESLLLPVLFKTMIGKNTQFIETK